jgi:peptidoglycan/xylan/chitin deacetylase (PgdA/CDA1 family)
MQTIPGTQTRAALLIDAPDETLASYGVAEIPTHKCDISRADQPGNWPKGLGNPHLADSVATSTLGQRPSSIAQPHDLVPVEGAARLDPLRGLRPVNKDSLKVAISAVWYAADALGRRLSHLMGRPPSARLVVIYYHGIPPGARAQFARQMDALTPATVVRAAHSASLPPGTLSVAITFDDALRSVGEHAVPELLRRSLPATIFVPVDFVGRPPAWETEAFHGDDIEQVMTADELRSLPDLFELGSHTLEHPHLTTLDDAPLREEIFGSRLKLEEITGNPVTLLAFPYGEYDRRTIDVCREAGYERVFAIDPRHADPLGRDFVRGRVSVGPNDSPLTFYLKTRGAYAWMIHASALKRAVADWRGRR